MGTKPSGSILLTGAATAARASMPTTASHSRTRSQLTAGRVAAYTAVVAAVLAVFALTWLLRDVFLIAFGAIVFAVVIRAAAHPLIHRAGLREAWAVALVVLVIVATGIGVGWLFGHQIAQQLTGLTQRLPAALTEVRQWIAAKPMGKFVTDHLAGLSGGGNGASALDGMKKFFTVSAVTVGHLFLMLFGGIYIAANPPLYRRGFVRLFPVRHRATLEDALLESGDALRRWITGQLVAMLAVGLLTGTGLALVGAPLPLVLGIVAGLLNFVPILGPFFSFVPGVLVAFTDSPQTALSAAAVYLVVQQLEGHAITPLAQRWAVKLPPAYSLVAIVSFGLLFGFFGVILGSPLAVVALHLVQRLYVKHGLEHATGATSTA